MGSVKADSVLQGISGLGDCDFFGAGGLQAINGLGETLGADWLDEVVNGIEIERLDCVFGVGGDHDRLGRRVKCFQEIEAGCARHLDIEKEGIRPFFANQFEGGGFGLGFPNDLNVWMWRKKLAKALKGESLVIAEDYTEHGSPSKSRVATTNPFASVKVKWWRLG